ncbi:hypothetical protein NOR_00144 [Metarhizium rileyi]|uniref:Uncharacterized protein n=1 Tax=Metarhizium rileyi (strain RCEF 4871) TaxID=1649241 RepID=A0A167KCR8_METRR|nr:hypothetical protein NOR_00144 [Metarhizium rileyi RCEF 4871]
MARIALVHSRSLRNVDYSHPPAGTLAGPRTQETDTCTERAAEHPLRVSGLDGLVLPDAVGDAGELAADAFLELDTAVDDAAGITSTVEAVDTAACWITLPALDKALPKKPMLAKPGVVQPRVRSDPSNAINGQSRSPVSHNLTPQLSQPARFGEESNYMYARA